MKQERSKEILKILALVVVYTIVGLLLLTLIMDGKPLAKLPGEEMELEELK